MSNTARQAQAVLDRVYLEVQLEDGNPAFGLVNARKLIRAALAPQVPQAPVQPATEEKVRELMNLHEVAVRARDDVDAGWTETRALESALRTALSLKDSP